MNGENRLQRQSAIHILVESRMDLLQLRYSKLLEFAGAFQAKLDGLADGFMRQPRWNSTSDQVSGRGPCIHRARTGSGLHASEIKLHILHPAGNQRQHGKHGLGRVKQRLLRLLHIFVVREG